MIYIISVFVLKELVDLVLRDLQGSRVAGVDAAAQLTCLEVGCGSGAVSLSLLKSLPQVRSVFIRLKMIEWFLTTLLLGASAFYRRKYRKLYSTVWMPVSLKCYVPKHLLLFTGGRLQHNMLNMVTAETTTIEVHHKSVKKPWSKTLSPEWLKITLNWLCVLTRNAWKTRFSYFFFFFLLLHYKPVVVPLNI